jgi:hypothetical protein
MYCSNCGAQSSEGDRFCRKCGSKFSDVTTTFSDVTTTPPPVTATTDQPRQNEEVTKRKSGFAVASFILGIIGLIVSPCLIFGLVFGAVALGQTGKMHQLSGRGLAIAGFIISLAGIILWVFAIFILFRSLKSIVSPAL